jgi:S-adenosylmethionine:diacylglycerol 3-amino-3-carboxypropyl transferase
MYHLQKKYLQKKYLKKKYPNKDDSLKKFLEKEVFESFRGNIS